MWGNGDSPRVARVMVGLVSFGFFIASVVATSANRDGLHHLAVASVVLTATLGFHLLHSAPVGVRARRRRWSLAAHGALTYAPYYFFQDTWVGIPGSFAAAVLLTTPAPRAWGAFVALVLLQAPLILALGESPVQALNSTVSHVVGGLTLFGMVRLADLAEELQTARAELALRAVDHERLRFARDLHDLCGYSLTAVALKCEQAQGHLRDDPRRAEEELAHTQALARQALSEVRAVSAGYRVLTLCREAQTAATLLESLEVTTEVDLAGRALPGPVDELLAIVVREGITNALRHCKVRHCAIRLTVDGGRARLEVSNDGAVPGRAGDVLLGSPATARPEGNGLHNLRHRVAEQNGVLTAVADGRGGFRLTAALPCRASEPVAAAAPARGQETAPASPPDAASERRIT